MAPLIPSAKATLSYPLYACDFDSLDTDRLVVGGGGGAGRSGVGNKIVSSLAIERNIWDVEADGWDRQYLIPRNHRSW
jgi:hypothetical protein